MRIKTRGLFGRHPQFLAFVLIVAVAVGGFGVSEMVSHRAQAADANEARRTLELVETSAALVHDLQLERGTSAMYAVSTSPDLDAMLVDYREGTDRSLAAFLLTVERNRDDLPIGARVATNEAETSLGRLITHRGEVDERKVVVVDSIQYYSHIINSLIDLGDELAPHPDSSDGRDAAAAFHDIARAKEAAGLERAVLADVLAAGSFGPLTLPKAVDLVGRQSQLLADMRDDVPETLIDEVDTALSAPGVIESEAMRDRILALHFDVAPLVWFETATVRVEALRDLESLVLDELDRALVELGDEAQTGVMTWGVVLAVIVLMGMLAVSRTSFSLRGHAVGIGVTAGVACSILVAAFFHSTLEHDREMQREQAVSDALARVTDGFDEYIDVTRAMAQVVSAQPALSRAEFIATAEELLDPAYRPGVSDLNWLTILEPREVPAFEARMRDGGLADFEVTPPTDETAVVVTYRYSSAGERPIPLGFDIRSNPTARGAVDAAAATGSAILTDAFPITTEGVRESAVIVYVPVYHDGDLIGFTNAVIVGRQFLEGVASLSPDVAVEIVDVNSDSETRLAATHPGHRFSDDVIQHTVANLGQTWGLRVELLDGGSPAQAWIPIVVLLAGLLSTAMVAIAVAQTRNGRIRAEELAAQRTVDLQRASADLASLNEIGRAISATLDGRAVLGLIVQHASRLVDADVCALFLVDHDKQKITHRLAAGIETAELEAHTYQELADGMSGYVWRTGVALRSADIESDPRNTGLAGERAQGRRGVSIIVAPIVENGKIVGTLSALSYDRRRPMTDVDKNSIDLLAAQASVAIRNAQMYERLKDTYEDLRVAQSARDEFVANISHEFRTPLTVISGATELLDEEADLADDERRELVRRVRANARRLEGLVQDVLLASRIEVGKAQPKPRVIDLRAKVATVVQDLGEIGDAVSNEVLPGLSVVADPEQLDRILFNLLSNAHKYGLPPVIVSTKNAGDVVELWVTDHGPGVGPDLKDKLFQRFEQGDGGPTRRSSGVGLGLHIVDELSRLNGGSVRYVENTGSGASFVVSLPVARTLAVIA